MTDDAGSDGYVGSNVFLAEVDLDRFESTLATPVALDAFPDRPDGLDDAEEARFGAVMSGDRNGQMFERMTPGDLVLCYTDGTYVGVGRVATTLEDPEVVGQLWDGAETAGSYVLEDFAPVSVPARVVNALFDYDPDYSPGGLIRVANGRVGHSLAAIRVAVERYSDRRA